MIATLPKDVQQPRYSLDESLISLEEMTGTQVSEEEQEQGQWAAVAPGVSNERTKTVIFMRDQSLGDRSSNSALAALNNTNRFKTTTDIKPANRALVPLARN